MGDKPKHRPVTQAKLLYDDQAVYVIFWVDDRYVRAVTSKTHGEVWQDSCVEFFFSPANSVDAGYFNLEINCGGTILMRFNAQSRVGPPLDLDDCRKIDVAHTLPKSLIPKLPNRPPGAWNTACRLKSW